MKILAQQMLSGARARNFVGIGLPTAGLILLWVGFVGLGSALTHAAPAGGTELRVGVSPILPPMVFKQGKQLVGVEVDLARGLAQHLQREVVFVELPWEEQIEALNAGRIDIIMSSMSVTMARRQVVEFTRPYFLTGQMALVRREDLHNYVLGFPMRPPGTVGVLEATTGDFLVQREFPKTKRKIVKTDQEAAQALAKKKIDLFISDSTLVWYLAGVHAPKGLAAVRIALSEEPLAWAVRRGNSELVAGANAFLEKAKQSGDLDRVFRRWMAIPE